MIYEALSCVAEEMNEFFRNKLRTSDYKVILSALVSQDGTVAVPNENRIVLTLVNIEREPVIKNLQTQRTGEYANPSLNINLHLLFSAYFAPGNYPESLRFISYVISFLQDRSVFTPADTPRLDKGIERLSFEMESPTTERLNNIWATLGAKYMPSVLYKMRMLTYDGKNIREYRPLITNTEQEGKPSSGIVNV